jgi:hypothetical protein
MKTPRQYIDELETITEHYSKLTERYADLTVKQAEFFNKRRQDFKSDNQCQKAFDLTEEGIEMQVVKSKIKSKEKHISTIKTALRLLENEAKNLF